MESLYLLLLSLTAVLVLLFYRYLIANYNYWKNRGIPTANGIVPGFGHLWLMFTMQKSIIIIVKDIFEAHTESMVGMFFVRNPVLIIRDADVVKTVLQTDFNSFRHRETAEFESDPLIYRNPLFLNDQKWENSRNQILTFVTTKKLKNLSLVVQDAASKFVCYMNNQLEGKNFIEREARDMFGRITMMSTIEAILSIEDESFDDATSTIFHKMMENIFEPTVLQNLTTIIFKLFPFLNVYFRDGIVARWINVKFTKIIADILKKRKNDEIKRNDMLQSLMEIGREKNLPDHAVIADTFSFFFGFIGAPSMTMGYLACELARHPHIQEKLREEINAVASKYDGKISYDAVNEMTYFDQVLSESMRLNPIADLHKICAEPTELKGPDGIRCRLKPGDHIVIPAYAIHRDPKHWKNPEEFRPERFDKGSKEFQERHKYAFLRFSEGPRMCAGMRLALFQVKTIVATILRNFVIEKSPKLREPGIKDPRHILVFMKGGVWIRLRRL